MSQRPQTINAPSWTSIGVGRRREVGAVQDPDHDGTPKRSRFAIYQQRLRTGGIASRRRPRSPLRLSCSEREEISRALGAGQSMRRIALALGRAPSTVSREVAVNGGCCTYRAVAAERRALQASRRPKTCKLARSPHLRETVEALLQKRWSPQQIAASLARDHPHDQEMRVSHETIYRSLFVQGKGALRAELSSCLRTGRAQRRARGGQELRGRLVGMVMISERPAEAKDRAVPGHWEGDLLLGKAGRSAIGTLVERRSRYVLLLALPGGRTAHDVREALGRRVRTLPSQLRRSLTWDQGKEMAEHVRFSIDTGMAVYFCDPHSPWQRGSNENTNGLLRQYFPKGTDLSVHTQADLDAVARELNGRPRQTLDWMKPSEVFAGFVAMTG
jgi:transposase, IS30 family